jgi:hypothetical protein
MSVLSEWKIPLAIVLCLSVLVGCITALRKHHAQQLYIVWYMFSLAFTAFVAIEIYVNVVGGFERALGGTGVTFLFRAYSYMTNFYDKVAFVAIVLGMVTLPQLLTYVLSGLSGSAIRPIFVSHFTQFAVWSS